ncbi:MAG: bifunctional DNA primase/polymerase [Candidatus Competibacter sp.]|nr:bifunctional DNA primase/polymerase [Candidatus Competibacter sp.]
MPNLLPAALAYVNRFGWPVFPVHGVVGGKCTCDDPRCSRPGKHPIARLSPRGLIDATLDPVKVTAWWRNAPYANIGVPTGAVSGLAVLDVDCAKGGDDGLWLLQHEHEPLPPTVMALTGGGGYHYLFQHPGAGVKVKNSVRTLGEGLDVRGDGGYIIVAPSSHASGRRYEWELSRHPRDVPLAPIPDWLLPLISDTPRPVTPPPGAAGRLSRREIARIRDALPFVDPDGYSPWLDVGMALHSTGDPAGFDLWTEWAAQSPKFDLDDHRYRWASFRSSGITLGTLFARAKEGGYAPASPPPADPPPPPSDPPPGGPNGPGGEWESRLYRSNRGDVITSPANLETILEHHDGWDGVLAYDEMSYRALKMPCWRATATARGRSR